ncbi:hypothetical protein M378DRAFT_163582 [Amanita muscaria Koide BX008]|uniref:NADH dehydrogenase [ubiquinone] iron-sulfur protein 5 n=1 Tax=Amanita muscaria (strain Koide BX008) TaxID=946122 RepID=A0A0C2SLQ7_AMAMK|nr:hypothetical protein M378DRAFT_163582 [Amanita muscaria Koide BX008]
MASGFGFTGGRSRCFTHWQEFQLTQCYIQSDKPTECRPLADDYLECLHRPKEIARAKAVQDEFIRKAKAVAKKEDRDPAEVIAQGTVGLTQGQQESSK